MQRNFQECRKLYPPSFAVLDKTIHFLLGFSFLDVLISEPVSFRFFTSFHRILSPFAVLFVLYRTSQKKHQENRFFICFSKSCNGLLVLFCTSTETFFIMVSTASCFTSSNAFANAVSNSLSMTDALYSILLLHQT